MHTDPETRIPTPLRLWSLREDVRLELSSDQLVLAGPWGECRVSDTHPLVRESLQRMSLGPVSLENVLVPEIGPKRWEHEGSDGACPQWTRMKRVLDQIGCCVVHSLGLDDGEGPLLSTTPVSRLASFRLPHLTESDPVRLSRFAAMRCSDNELVLESPLAQFRVVLHRPPAATVAASLGTATTVAGLVAGLGLPPFVVTDLVKHLIAAGMVLVGERESPPAGARFTEDTDPALTPWSPHVLFFHVRSRPGRDHGATAIPVAAAEPEPAAPVEPATSRFPLPKPVPIEPVPAEPTLVDVIRPPEFSARPVTVEQVGELLLRAVHGGQTGPAYPASSYQLHLYLSLDRCTGLPRGSYRYEPAEHVLMLVNDSESSLSELLDTARAAAGSTSRPPILITISARIDRLPRTLSGIAYATTLARVAALQHTFHLVATAMDLASDTLAIGDSAATYHALRLNWPREVSFGGFVVGSRP